MRSWRAPVCAMTLAVLISGAAVLPSAWLVCALLMVALMFAAGWPTLLGLPTQRGSSTVLALVGVSAVLVVALASRSLPLGHRSATTLAVPMQQLSWLAPVLALSVVVAFIHQLLRRDFRPRLVESVTGVVSGAVVVALVSGWFASAVVGVGGSLVHTATLATVGGVIPMLARLPRTVVAPVASILGALAGAWIVVLVEGLDLWPGLATGALIGLVVACFDRLFADLPSATSRRAALAHGAGIVCAAGAVTFLTAGLFA